MSPSQIFSEIPTWNVDQVRDYLDKHAPDQYTLLDVRQPEEYDEGHLPGARLIPVGELHERIGELEKTKPTIVYCRGGIRGGNGAAVLLNAEFKDVWNMAGGIMAWEDKVATGAPEAGMSWFEAAGSPEDYLALAWIIESGAKVFYERMAEKFAATDSADLFRSLAAAEEGHKDTLRDLYGQVSGQKGDPPEPDGVDAKDTMEGGVSISKALAWAEGQKAIDVLEFAIAMEVNAYDRYLKVAQSLKDSKSEEILQRLAREEKAHLDRLLESFVQQGAGGFLS